MGTLYASSFITSIMQYSQTCKLLTVSLFIYELAFSFIPVQFHTNLFWFPYENWFFSMVFDGKPTRSISEPTSVQRLHHIKTNDSKIDVGLQLY